MREQRDGIQVGALVRSLSGHDAGKLFLVVRMEQGFVWLCDGKCRTAIKCKKKNLKHVAETGLICSWMAETPERVNNTSVRYAIKELKKKTGGEA